jgi:hypothetical protein
MTSHRLEVRLVGPVIILIVDSYDEWHVEVLELHEYRRLFAAWPYSSCRKISPIVVVNDIVAIDLPERFEPAGSGGDPMFERPSETREAYLICLVSKNVAPLLESAIRNECSAYIVLIVL